jgi:short-subunit dehydrogenase
VPPEKVGEKAVKKTLKKKMIIVPGTLAKISSTIIRTLPKRWVAGIYNGLGN